jgi:hypothetical protein
MWLKKAKSQKTKDRFLRLVFEDNTSRTVGVGRNCVVRYNMHNSTTILVYVCNTETFEDVACYTNVKYYEVTKDE